MTAPGSSPPERVKKVVCPGCGADSIYASSNAFRPFCSARCKNIDLGAWASESFRLPASNRSDDQATDDEADSSASH
jgi:endogenous inhibitor of DNA gyrase (YacG/DUF329 family)